MVPKNSIECEVLGQLTCVFDIDQNTSQGTFTAVFRWRSLVLLRYEQRLHSVHCSRPAPRSVHTTVKRHGIFAPHHGPTSGSVTERYSCRDVKIQPSLYLWATTHAMHMYLHILLIGRRTPPTNQGESHSYDPHFQYLRERLPRSTELSVLRLHCSSVGSHRANKLHG